MTAGARVGLTDPDSPLAREIRKAIRNEGLAVSRFVMIGAAEDAGRLRSEDGEPTLVEPPTRTSIADLDALVLTGSGIDAEARSIAQAESVPVHDAAETPASALGAAAILAAAGGNPRSAHFSIVVPAAEEGTAGIEELFRQTGDALNFHETAAGVFRSRLAFNTFRDSRLAAREKAAHESLRRLFPDLTVTLLLARASLFHGYAGSAFLDYGSTAEARRAVAGLRSSRAVRLERGEAAVSPARAVELEKILVEAPDNLTENLALWFAFDGLALAARRAAAAVRTAVG